MLLEQSRAEQSRAEQSRAEQSNRIEWIDIAKGIAIICVILGHLGIFKINRVVFVFHMPLFFVLSGYFLSRRASFIDFCKNKAKTLLIPYTTTCVLTCLLSIVNAIYLNENISNTVWKWFAGSLYGAGFYPKDIMIQIPVFIGALWFLWALFWGLIITRRIIDQLDKRYHLLSICIIAWIGYQTSWSIWLPLDIQAGMTASLFLYIGYYTKINNLLTDKVRFELLFLSVFIVGWCIKCFKGFWMVSNSFGNGLMDIIGALAAIYLLRYFCDYISHSGKFSSLLRWYGSNSIVILCFHILELNLFPWQLVFKGFPYRMLIIIFLKLLFVTLCTMVVNKSPVLHFLFKGKAMKKGRFGTL